VRAWPNCLPRAIGNTHASTGDRRDAWTIQKLLGVSLDCEFDIRNSLFRRKPRQLHFFLLNYFTMAKKSRESNGASKESKPAKAPKSLVAVEAAVDPTLAALFASSVRFY
jgi:hypothetical protein